MVGRSLFTLSTLDQSVRCFTYLVKYFRTTITIITELTTLDNNPITNAGQGGNSICPLQLHIS